MNRIRALKRKDLEAVNEIYNQAVGTKFSTAHTKPVTMEERLDWFREHDPGQYPVFVWEEKGRIAGWICFSPYRKGRQALRSTAEISYYVHPDYHRRGIGTALMRCAIEKASELGFKALIAILLEPNLASIGLLEKFGFKKWGEMPSIAEIGGGAYNHLYYGLHLAPKLPEH